MPRGRKKTTEITELPVITTDEESGTIPFFLIDDEFGIACDQYCYMLCRKKRANKTVNDENGQPHHIESYWMWSAYRYTNSFETIMYTYVNQKEKDLNKKLVKEKDFKKIIKNYEQVRNIIKEAFDVEGLNKDFTSFNQLIDQHLKLKDELDGITQTKKRLLNECEELEKLIKEKRKIIIK